MRIKRIIDETELLFEDGSVLESEHETSCCEIHWLDFSVMANNCYVSTATGKKINIFEQEFDFSDGVPFKKVEGLGILLYDICGNKYLINGYGDNNGCYSYDINLVYKDRNGNEIFRYDVTECQDYQG